MIYDLLRSMIKTGIGKKTDDTGMIRRAVVKWLGIEQRVESLVPYGTFGSPPEGIQYLLLKRRCNEANVAGIACDPANRIKKDTKSGEYGVGNPITKSNMYFKENGDAVIEIPKGLFSVVNSEGNATVDATEIILNDGTKGVARKDDTTMVNMLKTDIDLLAPLILATGLFLPSGATPVLSTTDLPLTDGKITSASSTVKAG